MMQFLTDHAGVLLAAGVALLDFLFAMNPSWSSNGILHAIYLMLKGGQKA